MFKDISMCLLLQAFPVHHFTAALHSSNLSKNPLRAGKGGCSGES